MRDVKYVSLLERLVKFLKVTEDRLAVMIRVLRYGSDRLIIKVNLCQLTILCAIRILASLFNHPGLESFIHHI